MTTLLVAHVADDSGSPERRLGGDRWPDPPVAAIGVGIPPRFHHLRRLVVYVWHINCLCQLSASIDNLPLVDPTDAEAAELHQMLLDYREELLDECRRLREQLDP